MLITHAFRMTPGQDLKKEISLFAKKKNIRAGWIGCCVGSLSTFHLRYANQRKGVLGKGHFEITCLTGTVSINGLHLHITFADEKGICNGGHLLDGNIIYTTAEIIILEETSLTFTREQDERTGWQELKIVNQ